MWPFKKRTTVATSLANATEFYTQVDITAGFNDNLRLEPGSWIETISLNYPKEGKSNLPLPDATSEEIYQIAMKLSTIRESINLPSDGVYCPVCHIANIDLNKLHTPCPKCKRNLLKFGWD